MAEVAITLDNSAGFLPVEFSEVTIARRAYRSGENEYFINRNRVRLKDVEDVVSSIAHDYSVVNQGLADAALLLKPDQRRGLFEEAADVSRLNLKRKEAEGKLASTQQNVVRVSDIAAELEPRLRSLKRQANQAEAYNGLVRDLRLLRHESYDRRLNQAEDALQAALDEEEKASGDLDGAMAGLAEDRRQLESLRQQRAEQQRLLGLWLEDQRECQAQLEVLGREQAVLRERESSLARQRAELAEEIASLDEASRSEERHLAGAEERLADYLAESRAQAAEVAKLEERLATREGEHTRAQEQLARCQERAFSLASKQADLRNRLAQLRERYEDLNDQIRASEEMVEERREQATRKRAEAGAILKTMADLDAQAEEQAKEAKRLEAELASSGGRQRQLERELEEARRQESEARTRLDLLSRLRDSGAGYYTGVKAVLEATAGRTGGQRLQGVVGLVANLVVVPAKYEVAIEVALGAHLQDIVVERWEQAEAAISHLKRTNSGRATFMPLDVMKGSSEVKIASRKGVLGSAVSLVQFEERLRNVFTQLLGRTIVVEDLQVARELLRDEDRRYTLVTLSGEIVHPAGSVTGGSSTKQAGILSRERELRELPGEIERLGRELRQHEEMVRGEKSSFERLQEALGEVKVAERHRESLRTMHKDGLLRAQRELDQAQQQLESHEPVRLKLQNDLAALKEKETAMKRELAGVEVEAGRAQESLQTCREEIAVAGRERAQELERLSDLRGRASTAEEVYRKQAAITQTHQLNLRRASEDRERRTAKLAELTDQDEELKRTRADLQARVEAKGTQATELAGLVGPAQQSLNEQVAREQELEDRIAGENQRLFDLEAGRGRAAVESERCRGELSGLRSQARADLGDESTWPQAKAAAEIEDLTDEELERRVEQLAQRIHRLEPVNLAAVGDYEREASHLEFLHKELNDLTQAEKSLRQVIVELDRLTQQRFESTFAAVNEAFQEYFVRLFGAGSAKLVLTSPDDLQHSGIEVVAQPPRKRQQPLAALSGGERALTSAALLFAILKINPSPFTLLDEVDAALDEANVGRFRECLQELSERTQFIVITHNQGTIQAADTLYGISMGPDGVSKVVSLDLNGYLIQERESA
jgi:chromosome segregation protein